MSIPVNNVDVSNAHPIDKMNKDVTPADKDGYDLQYYPSTGWRYIAIKTDE